MTTPLPPELTKKLREIARRHHDYDGRAYESDLEGALKEFYPLIREHVMRECTADAKRWKRVYEEAGDACYELQRRIDAACHELQRRIDAEIEAQQQETDAKR